MIKKTRLEEIRIRIKEIAGKKSITDEETNELVELLAESKKILSVDKTISTRTAFEHWKDDSKVI